MIDIPVLLLTFMMDGRTQLLFATIAMDVVTGVMCALRSGQFQWSKLALFYRTNVVPYILGWFVIFTFGQLGITVLFGDQWGEIVSSIGYAPALVTLGASIAENLSQLRTGTPKEPYNV
jgi:hypothetical protein